MKTHISRALLACFLTFGSLTGCGSGGGGGGEEFVGAANVQLRLQPSRIDSGDRTLVTVEVSEVHKNGIALKVRFPKGLRYVPASATLTADDKETDVTPTVNTPSADGGDIYLVFYLAQSLFRPSGQEYNGETGIVTFQLEGTSVIRDGKVEIDADVDDPAEDNSVEFKLENPEFAAEDEASVSVVD
jgi:hypothetical protein